MREREHPRARLYALAMLCALGGCECGAWDPKPGTDPATENQRRCELMVSSQSYRGVDLRGCDLSYRSFDDRDFEGAQLANAVFEHSTFRGARFVDADLHDVEATGVDFSGSDFTRANMHEFRAAGSQFRNCVMVAVDLEGGGFAGTSLEDTTLRHANLRNVHIGDVGLSGVRFDGADLRGAVFESAMDGSWLGTTCPDGSLSLAESGEFCSAHRVPGRRPAKLQSSRAGR